MSAADADQFVAEIRIFPFNFSPAGWAECDGQLLPISQNTALFSLLGTTYGGDGKSTFALPDLQGMVAMHPGQGPGLSLHDLGEASGVDAVTLLQSEMPSHNHSLRAVTDPGDLRIPTPTRSIARSQNANAYSPPTRPDTSPVPIVPMSPFATQVVGGGLPHNNLQPYLTLRYCIALQGVFPPRG